jgi:nucleoside 2-deoxyribosyltransferase
MRKLNCFIASAFGHQDVNSIFERGISITLKELNINCHRVDKINHNDKIDKKILQLIDQCDFGIVDLTFARPSVYYEAGLLEGQKKPVIFISKSDHFRPKIDDEYGNFKIHFDLVTKNIIPWTTPNQQFKKLLKARVKLVTRPIVENLSISHLDSVAQFEFEKKSILERTESVKQRLVEYAIKNRFVYKKVKGMGFNRLIRGKTELKIVVYNSITSSQLSDIGYRSFMDVNDNSKTIILLGLLKPITKNRLEHTLKRFSPITDTIYTFQETKLIVIQPITSIPKLESFLKNISI